MSFFCYLDYVHDSRSAIIANRRVPVAAAVKATDRKQVLRVHTAHSAVRGMRRAMGQARAAAMEAVEPPIQETRGLFPFWENVWLDIFPFESRSSPRFLGKELIATFASRTLRLFRSFLLMWQK